MAKVRMPDLTTHASSIGIMVVMNLLFLGAVVYAYCQPSCPTELRTILAGAFTGYQGALLLALKGAADKTSDTPPPPAPEVK